MKIEMKKGHVAGLTIILMALMVYGAVGSIIHDDTISIRSDSVGVNDGLYVVASSSGSQIYPGTPNEGEVGTSSAYFNKAYVTTYIGTFGASAYDTALCWDNSGVSNIYDCSTVSRRDMKENFDDYKGGLNAILQLVPTYYTWIPGNRLGDEHQPIQLGLIADDVLRVEPTAIKYKPSTGELQDYKDRSVQAMIISAIQEMKAGNCKEFPQLDYCDNQKIIKSKDKTDKIIEYKEMLQELKINKEGMFNENI